jgi:hypothetical protein
MSIQPRLRSASASWLRPARALRRQIGRMIAFLFRNPALLAAVFVAGAALCLSVLLTADRAPAAALPPAPTSGDCAMFCTDRAPEPALADATTTTAFIASDQSADQTQSCWMFCEPFSSSPSTIAFAQGGPPSAATAWHLDP